MSLYQNDNFDDIKCDNYSKIGILIPQNNEIIGSGKIKLFYSDFIVKEIDKCGNTLCLKNINVPDYLDLNDFNNECISSDIKDKLNEFDKCSANIIHIDNVGDKDCRKNIHMYIRRKFCNMISDVNEDKSRIIVKKVSKSKSYSNKDRWPKNIPSYIGFILYKENISTNDAIKMLAKCLKINPNEFSFAGTKDKRAITVQKVHLRKVNHHRLYAAFNTIFPLHKEGQYRFLIGDYSREEKPLFLGDLKGNYFEIIIREFITNDKNIDERINVLINEGFANFFGKQRFGVNTSTYEIGRHIITCNWECAVDSILLSGKCINDTIKKVVEHYKITKDSVSSLKLFENCNRNCIEFNVLKSIKENNNKIDEKCLNYIPFVTQSLYLHSFQSYIWNIILSRRILKYNKSIIVGDMVKIECEIEYITHEDILNNKYTINDVILPLPGYNILYPNNEIYHWYEEELSKFSIEFHMFKHKIKKYSIPGSYRYIFVKPLNFTHTIFNYTNYNSILITDSYHIGITPQKSIIDNNDDTTLKTALKLTFSLPSSSYATTLLSELIIDI